MTGPRPPSAEALLAAALERALERCAPGPPTGRLARDLAGFSWAAVFSRVAAIWDELLAGRA